MPRRPEPRAQPASEGATRKHQHDKHGNKAAFGLVSYLTSHISHLQSHIPRPLLSPLYLNMMVTYHVRLGLAMVLALEGTGGGLVRRGAEVCRKSLGGHCEGSMGLFFTEERKLGKARNKRKTWLASEKNRRRRGRHSLSISSGGKPLYRVHVDKLPSLATEPMEGQLGPGTCNTGRDSPVLTKIEITKRYDPRSKERRRGKRGGGVT